VLALQFTLFSIDVKRPAPLFLWHGTPVPQPSTFINIFIIKHMHIQHWNILKRECGYIGIISFTSTFPIEKLSLW
jgi:hypothetical protein